MTKISQVVVMLVSVVTAAQCMVISTDTDNTIPNFSSTSKLQGHRHRHQHGRIRSKVNSRSRKSNHIEKKNWQDEVMLSPRVVLAHHKPVLPPVDLMEEPTEDLDDLAQQAIAISDNSTSEAEMTRRAKRSIDFVHVPVCDSVSEWVERTEAHDMWGNKVIVMQEIDIGGTRVNQYFFETKCRNEKSACVGIDTSQYYSVCKNKHVWAYAKVQTISGDEGWNLIKIPGSCNCALFKKKAKRFSLLDLLQDVR